MDRRAAERVKLAPAVEGEKNGGEEEGGGGGLEVVREWDGE